MATLLYVSVTRRRRRTLFEFFHPETECPRDLLETVDCRVALSSDNPVPPGLLNVERQTEDHLVRFNGTDQVGVWYSLPSARIPRRAASYK